MGNAVPHPAQFNEPSLMSSILLLLSRSPARDKAPRQLGHSRYFSSATFISAENRRSACPDMPSFRWARDYAALSLRSSNSARSSRERLRSENSWALDRAAAPNRRRN